jgi:hypothetical protein
MLWAPLRYPLILVLSRQVKTRLSKGYGFAIIKYLLGRTLLKPLLSPCVLLEFAQSPLMLTPLAWSITMPKKQSQDKNQFLYPHHPYRGEFTPTKMVFNANLQEFSQRVGYICALETGGKLTPEDAYKQVKHLWQDLKQSYKSLDL